MKTLLTLSVLALSSLAAAADPCKLLSPGEVRSRLGAPAVSAEPDTDQDFATCNFDFEDGSLVVQVISPAEKLLQGRPLLSVLGSGESSIKDLKALTGLGDEAAGPGPAQINSGVPQDFAMLFVRKGDTLLMLWGVSSNHSVSKLTLPSLTLLAQRALLRLR